jgi:hypothetical protein
VSPYKLLADALDDVAARLADAVTELRELEEHGPELEPDDDRRRENARARMRRYRARRAAGAEPRYPARNRDASDAPDPRNRDASDAAVTPAKSANLGSNGARLRPTPLEEEVGVTDGRAVTRDASDARNRDARDARDDQPASPWRAEPEPDDLTRTDEDRERLATTLAAIRAEHGMKGKP